jgi:hypothetical protein
MKAPKAKTNYNIEVEARNFTPPTPQCFGTGLHPSHAATEPQRLIHFCGSCSLARSALFEYQIALAAHGLPYDWRCTD